MTSSLRLPLGSGVSAEAKAPFTGKPYKRPDSTWAGLYRLSRVCAHASVHTGLPRRSYSDGHRDAFSEALRNLSIRCGALKHPNPSRTLPPANVQTRVREYAGRIALPPIVLMSSGRLFLDRVARQQSPSPLRRQAQHTSVAGSKETIYHRTVSSVLTGCLKFRDRRSFAIDALENGSVANRSAVVLPGPVVSKPSGGDSE